MKLTYGVNSPYARKVRVVLAEKGLAYEPVVMNNVMEQAGPDFAKLNPNLRVPLLEDGANVLFESNVVVEYLLSTYPDASAGGTPPLARTLTRAKHHWDDALTLATIETTLDCGINLFQCVRHGIDIHSVAFLRRDQERIGVNLDWLEARLTPEGFVPGVLSIQDLNLAITWIWLNFRKPLPLPTRPKLDALVQRYAGRPSFQSTQPQA